MKIQNNIYESAKLQNLDNVFVSINEAKEILRCSREVIVDLVDNNIVRSSVRNGGQKTYINKADLQLLVIKITDIDYPKNFGKYNSIITKHFPVSKLQEVN